MNRSSSRARKLRRTPRTRAWSAAMLPLGAAVVMAALVACSTAGSAAPGTVTVTSTVTAMSTVTIAAPGSDTGAETAADDVLASTPPDPCSLISQDEADTLAGTPLDPPAAAAESCTYSGPVSGPLGQVEVYVGDGAKKFLDVERDLGHELRPLDGVGDEAYAGEETTFVRRGFLWVAIHLVRLNDPAENAGPLEDIIRAVADRIG